MTKTLLLPEDESDVEFVIGHSLWDEGDYVVTIRPNYEKVWRSLPLGGVLSERQARLIAEWLQGAMPTLWKIFQNISKERIEKGEARPRKLSGSGTSSTKENERGHQDED